MIEASREETERAQGQLADIERSCVAMRTTLHELEKKLNQRRIELTQREAAVQAEERRVDEGRRSLDASMAALTGQQTEWKEARGAAETVIAKENARLEALKETLEAKSKELQEREQCCEKREADATAYKLGEQARLDALKESLEGKAEELDEVEAITRAVREQAALALEKQKLELEGLKDLLESKSKDLQDKENSLSSQQKEIEARKAESERALQSLKERAQAMKKEREDQQKKLEELVNVLVVGDEAPEPETQESRSLEEKLKEVHSTTEEMAFLVSKSVEATESDITAVTTCETDEEKKEPTATEEGGEAIKPGECDAGATLSESEKRKRMIDDELQRIVRDTEKEELESPMETEVIEALTKAAHKICYVKKYYDVYKDEVIYFPAVVKTIMTYDLMEEADKYYFGDSDELPMQVSAGLRSVAANTLAEAKDDVDEEYMEKLASNVDLD